MPICGAATNLKGKAGKGKGPPCSRWVAQGHCWQHQATATTTAAANSTTNSSSEPSPTPTQPGAFLLGSDGRVITIKTAEERLLMITLLNPQLAADIDAFIRQVPRFRRYLALAAIDELPAMPVVGWQHFDANEMLLCYVCFAGVNTRYGEKLWARVQGKSSAEIAALSGVGAAKQATLAAVAALPPLTSRAQVEALEISGVGIGAKRHLYQYFWKDDQVIASTDLSFRKGITEIYGREKLVTPAEAEALAAQWPEGLRHVGSMFCFQACHYSKFLPTSN